MMIVWRYNICALPLQELGSVTPYRSIRSRDYFFCHFTFKHQQRHTKPCHPSLVPFNWFVWGQGWSALLNTHSTRFWSTKYNSEFSFLLCGQETLFFATQKRKTHGESQSWWCQNYFCLCLCAGYENWCLKFWSTLKNLLQFITYSGRVGTL